MQVRISESEDKLADAIKELEARLRDARHLQILAPIQPKTRELVIHAAGRLSGQTGAHVARHVLVAARARG